MADFNKLIKYLVIVFAIVAIVSVALVTTFVLTAHDQIMEVIPREVWHARAPKEIQDMTNPVPYVVIHHSYQPAACYNLEDCCGAMRWMQDYHQINNSWADIGYSFAVGSDGRAYEGRGWSRVGAHAPTYNDRSIGICLIGDWTEELPPQIQLDETKKLIDYGVSIGMIQETYRLVGHRQVRRGTECPGDRLYAEIATWKHHYAGTDLKKYPPE